MRRGRAQGRVSAAFAACAVLAIPTSALAVPSKGHPVKPRSDVAEEPIPAAQTMALPEQAAAGATSRSTPAARPREHPVDERPADSHPSRKAPASAGQGDSERPLPKKEDPAAAKRQEDSAGPTEREDSAGPKKQEEPAGPKERENSAAPTEREDSSEAPKRAGPEAPEAPADQADPATPTDQTEPATPTGKEAGSRGQNGGAPETPPPSGPPSDHSGWDGPPPFGKPSAAASPGGEPVPDRAPALHAPALVTSHSPVEGPPGFSPGPTSQRNAVALVTAFRGAAAEWPHPLRPALFSFAPIIECSGSAACVAARVTPHPPDRADRRSPPAHPASPPDGRADLALSSGSASVSAGGGAGPVPLALLSGLLLLAAGHWSRIPRTPGRALPFVVRAMPEQPG
jgi:hypothetical protein